jgi:hypothetical protein
VWDKQYKRWDELVLESITYYEDKANLITSDGDCLFDVPVDSFEVISK